jgi:hypothetical protein
MATVELLKAILAWAEAHPSTTTIYIFILTTLLSAVIFLVRWIWKQYRISHPFDIGEAEDYSDGGNLIKSKYASIEVECINGLCSHYPMNLHFKVKRKIILQHINLRFVAKSFPNRITDAPENVISIDKVHFPQKDKYYAEAIMHHDKKGGMNCIFKEPLNLSEGNVLFLEVYPSINVKNIINEMKWEGFISLDNSAHDEKRTFTRKKVIVTNVNLIS